MLILHIEGDNKTVASYDHYCGLPADTRLVVVVELLYRAKDKNCTYTFGTLFGQKEKSPTGNLSVMGLWCLMCRDHCCGCALRGVGGGTGSVFTWRRGWEWSVGSRRVGAGLVRRPADVVTDSRREIRSARVEKTALFFKTQKYNWRQLLKVVPDACNNHSQDQHKMVAKAPSLKDIPREVFILSHWTFNLVCT